MKLTGNGIVAQSGGPTAVINNSVCGVVQEWEKRKMPGTLLGAIHGIRGVMENNFINLSAQAESDIEGLKYTPGAALGSCRYKITREKEYLEILNIFRKLNVRYFFYIGGNDSMDTANKIYRLAQKHNYEMYVMGLPKTIDNDLPFTDHCPGYGSAAKYLATTVMETGMDLKGLLNNTRVLITEAMGRNTGWLAASAALAKKEEDDAPHLVYLPEVAFNKERFLTDVEEAYNKYGSVYVVASEGLVDEKGDYVFADKGKDSFGHVQLGGLASTLKNYVEKNLDLKARCNVLGTAQRAAMHYASRVDAEEAYMVGSKAVQLTLEGISGAMVNLVRDEESDYCRTGSVALGKVANVEKKMPAKMISGSGRYVTNHFINYVKPLIAGEVFVPTKDGLPHYINLKGMPSEELNYA